MPTPTLSPERFQRARQILDTAWSLVGPEQQAFLERECGADRELRAAVQALLQAGQGMDSFLEAPALGELDPTAAPAARMPQQLGPWRLLGELGRGGMGTVYLGERADGRFEKRVAVKLVRSGLYNEELHRRFLAERQILAGLEHPGIARLLDSGETPDGVPYLVMEYVAGEALLEYCAGRKLGVEARIALFRDICAAVQYAHQHLVVHRDLKPSNILVTAEGSAKLLDFGVAKLLETGSADLTVTGQRVMTPQYASPEQIRGEAVTTASDVYSLGVILYELLTGRRPYRLKSGAPHELASAICDQQPERPSTALATVDTVVAGAVPPLQSTSDRGDRADRVVVARNRRRLRGDLDTIVLKALQKVPGRRYASVAEFSEDLRRHLARLPVLAQPDSLGYRARKFLGRHRLGVAAVVLLALSLAGGLLASMVQARVARAERDRARIEAETARQTAAFLTEIFAIASPVRARGATITARDILDQGAARIETELAGEPEVRARLLDALGHVYLQLGVYPPARKLFQEELEIQRARYGRYSRQEARALFGLGSAASSAGETPQARKLLELSLAIDDGRGVEDRQLVQTLGSLGVLYVTVGDYERAGVALRRSLEMLDRLGLDDPALRGTIFNQLGVVAWQTGQLDQALVQLQNALDISERIEDEVLTGRALSNLAQVLRLQGKYAEAVPLLERLLSLTERLYGVESINTARALENQASLYNDLEDFAHAEPLYLRSIATYERTVGPEHPHLAFALKNYGNLLKSAGQYEGARDLYRRAYEIRQKKLGDDNPDVAMSLMNLGEIEGLLGNRGEAEQLLRRAVLLATRTLGPDHLRLADALAELATVLADPVCTAEARVAFAEVVRIRTAKLPAGHDKIGSAQRSLAACGQPAAPVAAPAAD